MFTLPAYGDHRDLHSFPTRRSSDLGSCEKYATRFCEQHEKHVCKNNSNQKYAARFDKQYKIEYAGKSNATSKYTARFFNPEKSFAFCKQDEHKAIEQHASGSNANAVYKDDSEPKCYSKKKYNTQH